VIGPRKTPTKQPVQCPACQHTQWEYAAAAATHCRSCGTRIPIQEKKNSREPVKVRLNVERKEITCHHCQHFMIIPVGALSWQCPGCSSYLDFKDHVIDRESTAAITTYGKVTVGAKGVAGGVRIEAFSADISGRVLGRLYCLESIQLSGRARLASGATSQKLHVTAGAQVEIQQPVDAPVVHIEGKLKAGEILADHVVVGPEGELLADTLKIFSLQVEKGGCCQARVETREIPPTPETAEPPPPEEEDPLADFLK
jgi:cytoskeletal protein CcmA (bactofilin family)/ribosomal protein L37AE/L43A